MQPAMLLKLLRKLTIDVSKLSEYTTVALRVRVKFKFSVKFSHFSSISFLHCTTKGAPNTTAQLEAKVLMEHLPMKKNV